MILVPTENGWFSPCRGVYVNAPCFSRESTPEFRKKSPHSFEPARKSAVSSFGLPGRATRIEGAPSTAKHVWSISSNTPKSLSEQILTSWTRTPHKWKGILSSEEVSELRHFLYGW